MDIYPLCQYEKGENTYSSGWGCMLGAVNLKEGFIILFEKRGGCIVNNFRNRKVYHNGGGHII